MVEFVRTPEEGFKNIPNELNIIKIKNKNGKQYGRQTKYCYYYA